FSDYATKYRVAFIPPGEQAVYQDGQDGANPNGAIEFPLGTVLAKTFAFTDEEQGTEQLVETRLLIKRENSSGNAYWAGLPYTWGEDGVARLAMGGGSRAVSWHYRDVDSGAVISGDTERYNIPNANQFISCHGNDDQASGSPSIAPKLRRLHLACRTVSTYKGEQGQGGFPRVDQLQYWVGQGLLAGAPQLQSDSRGVAANVRRLPPWNVARDGGEAAHSSA